MFSTRYCKATSFYKNADFYTGSTFCAGYDDGRADSCQADSGGPLICVRNFSPFVYGLVSYGYDCADPNYPGMYSKVATQIQWIDSVVGNYSISDLFPRDLNCFRGTGLW